MSSWAVNRLFQNSTNNGRTGFALTKPANNGSLRTVYNVTKGTTRIRRGMAKIGSGAQGMVFLASTDKAGKRKVVIKVSPFDKYVHGGKQPARAEYDIQKAVYKVVPRHVPKPIEFFTTQNYIPVSNFNNRRTSIYNYDQQQVMVSEYAHGGSLKDWLRKMATRVTEKLMADLVRQIISTLKKIHARYPEFRHNDLHLGNIYVDDTKAKPRYMIADFGLSRLTTQGSNPVVNRSAFRNVGITPYSSYKYDLHFFLNSLNGEIRGNLPETRAFLHRMLPPEYRGLNSARIKSFRLKNGGVNTGLPTFAQILSDPFVSGRSSPRRRANTGSSPNVSTGALFRSPTPRRPSPGRNAADIASSALANLPGVSVSTTARRPTAAEVARMSPRSRAALAVRPRATNSRTVRVRTVAHTRGANVVREMNVRVPVARRYLAVAGPGRNTTTRAMPVTEAEVRRLHELAGLTYTSPRSRSPRTNANSPTRLAARRVTNQAIRRVVALHSPTRVAARNVVNRAIQRIIARNARNRAAPAPIPAMTYRERARLARSVAAGRRAAGRNARARGPRPARTAGRTVVPPARVPAPRVSPNRGNLSNTRAHAILNSYANGMNNQRTLTRRMLKTKLTSVGYAANSAETHARSWEAKWLANRASANKAMKNLRAGKNLAKRGYSNNAAAIAHRRVALGLHKGPNGRVRKYSNSSSRGTATLLSSKRKPELVNMAQRHGIAGASAMTRDQLVNALYG
jgi:serine/threonine protein kinase